LVVDTLQPPYACICDSLDLDHLTILLPSSKTTSNKATKYCIYKIVSSIEEDFVAYKLNPNIFF
jgi:hypothetical protein